MINPVSLAIKVEQLATGTPTLDPTPFRDRKVLTGNPLTSVRIAKLVICTSCLFFDISSYIMYYQC